MENMPMIKISFYLAGDMFDVNEVTRQLGILPTKVREKNSFPIKEFAHTEWVLDTGREYRKAVSWKFEELIKLLIGKENIINRICSTCGLEAGFCVTIWMENGDNPEMVLTKEIISFLASINAEVGFDIYVE